MILTENPLITQSDTIESLVVAELLPKKLYKINIQTTNMSEIFQPSAIKR